MHAPSDACVCAGVHFWASMCARVCGSVISGLRILFRIYANPLNMVYLYTCHFDLIFSISDYMCLFLRAGDVAHFGACDRVNQLRSSIFT